MEVKQRLIAAGEAVRKKHDRLKRLNMKRAEERDYEFRPISEPLKALVKKEIPNYKFKQDNEDDLHLVNDEDISACQKTKKRKRSDVTFTTLPQAKFPNNETFDASRFEENMGEEGPCDEDPEIFQEAESITEEPEDMETSQRDDSFDHYEHWGPVGRTYMKKLYRDTSGSIDHNYGPRLDVDELMVGDSKFEIDDNDNIILTAPEGDASQYRGTEGVFELLFTKKPDRNKYDDNDLLTYQNIISKTNAKRRGYDSEKQIQGTRSYKWTNILSKLKTPPGPTRPINLRPSRLNLSGEGVAERLPQRYKRVTGNAIDYVHWDNPNELVGRLRLLIGSRRAGNTGLDNEIWSIIEELEEAGIVINSDNFNI